MFGFTGNFDIETKVLDKIQDTEVLTHIDKMDKAVSSKNYKKAILEINKAIDKCQSFEDKMYCIFAKAAVLYYDNNNIECGRVIEQNIDNFKKVFKFTSTELWRLYTMLWHCDFRKKQYIRAICDLCSCRYFSGFLQTVCFVIILCFLAYRVSFQMFYLTGQYIGTVLTAAAMPVITSIVMFLFNGALRIRKRPI